MRIPFRWKKRLTLTGLLLAVIGFHVRSLPPFRPLVGMLSSSFADASAALQVLKRDRALEPEARGFEALSELILRELARRNPDAELEGVVIVRLERGDSPIAFDPATVPQRVPVLIRVKGQAQPLDAGLDELDRFVADAGRRVLQRWSLALFWIGILFAGLSALVEEKRPLPAPVASKSPPVPAPATSKAPPAPAPKPEKGA
jgi:hypothetical protein